MSQWILTFPRDFAGEQDTDSDSSSTLQCFDVFKEKTKVVQRNSVNPVWSHSTQLRINFVDLAFLRLAVCDRFAMHHSDYGFVVLLLSSPSLKVSLGTYFPRNWAARWRDEHCTRPCLL